MQYQESDCGGTRAIVSETDVLCLWPSSTPEDVIRCKLACILSDDPDHRLRVAHLEALLQLALGSSTPCSSGRLQALLTDPTTAKIFPVDFNAQVPDWRSRVVHLDVAQLTHSLNAAKQQQQQQTDGAAKPASNGEGTTLLQRGNSSGCGESAALTGHLVLPSNPNPPADVPHSNGRTDNARQQQAVPITGKEQPPAQSALQTIFGSASAYAGRPSHQGSSSLGAFQPSAHSHSMPGPENSSSFGTAGPRQMPTSLFGSAFEVPYAIASCWANPEGSFSSSGVGMDVRHQVHEALPGTDTCGSSSMASGSSARSLPTAGAAAARQAPGGSRLKHASTSLEGERDMTSGQPAAANSIDVCTPRSGLAAAGDSDRSPAHSSAAADEDTEYSEAQLVFGSVNAAGGSNALAAAVAAGNTAGANENASAQGSPEVMPVVPGAEGDAAAEEAHLEAELSMQGVDWSCLAGLQQQQQTEATYVTNQQQQPLLFGLDDVTMDTLTPRTSSGGGGAASASMAAAAAAATARSHSSALAATTTGALTARRLLMDQAGNSHMATLASSLGALGPSSLPNTLQQQQHEQLLLAAAAAVGSNGALGALAAERMLQEQEGLQYSSWAGSQHFAALAGSLQGNSYGSGGLLSDQSFGSGLWSSPAAMQQHLLLQQQRQQAAAAAAVVAAAAAAQQQQHMRGSLNGNDGVTDTDFRSDQAGKEQHAAGAAGRNLNTNQKGAAITSAASMAGVQSHQGTDLRPDESTRGGGVQSSALTPRLTGWASIAAKEPPAGSTTMHTQQPVPGVSAQQTAAKAQQQVSAAAKGAADVASGKAVAKLPARVKAEVQHLVTQFQGVLRLEDFDDGVVHQLNAKRTEDEAVAAVRHIAHYELGTIQHMAAYLNHLVKHYNHNAAAAAAAAAAAETSVGLSNALAAAAAAAVAANHSAVVTAHGSNATAATMQQLLGASMLSGAGSLGSTAGSNRGGAAASGGAAGGLVGAFGGQIRLASVPVSTKAMLQKLPLKVFKQIEALVQSCAYLEWRHFDAGVIKVLSQLSKLCEADVFEELELLAATDLSNVEYMPAYLNKRLNNKLWSRRKAEGHVPS